MAGTSVMEVSLKSSTFMRRSYKDGVRANNACKKLKIENKMR